MTNYIAAPNNSRYVPFTQQKACCVPTSISMIMYRNNIPLIPAEELGYRLGLTVSKEAENLFYNVRTADNPPPSGFGTQIYEAEYEPNKVFSSLGIPLKFTQVLAEHISDEKDLVSRLKDIEAKDIDALLCFNHGAIKGKYEPYSGHVAVFDRVIKQEIQLVDASPSQPKWRTVSSSQLFDAIQKHGNANSGGIWLFENTSSY